MSKTVVFLYVVRQVALYSICRRVQENGKGKRGGFAEAGFEI